ncbi:P-type ATPase [Paludibacterium denitrificans]|uniref:P-type ATPase n=1 Tax=Paludibacterium denitrificans TaxID=2675226 RepID=UPI0028AF8C42|nr:hypothetical protein [Paludibacterium denitrificans]
MALQHLLPQKVEVRREGGTQTVLATELVPGDVILLAEGAKVLKLIVDCWKVGGCAPIWPR